MRKISLICLLAATTAFGAQSSFDPSEGQWLVYGGDKANTKYAPYDQIDAANVSELQVAWTWDSIDNELKLSGNPYYRRSKFEATPLMVDGVLYLTTSLSRAVALDPGTGETLWVHDPKAHEPITSRPIGYLHRGLAFWTDGGERRLFYGTTQAYLTALNPKDGKPIASFGDNGVVDLTKDVLHRPDQRRVYSNTSPPIVVGDVVVIGCWISDATTTKRMPRGDVRGFDVRTGKLLWTFHTIPRPGEYGHDTWEGDSWTYTGNTNAWSVLSADEELGYVYLPIGAATHNWYGGHRLGDNLFSGSLVCLDARTGERVWHRQLIHHDIWDYDVPAAPNLVDITVDGRRRKAVAQVMKNGFCFVLDRATGEPIWPIEERAVPPSAVPGERASATQPFPSKPPPFERQGASADDLIDFTPELRREALALLQQYESGPLYTPPSAKGTLVLPGYGGGANWGGAAFDPATGFLYVPSMTSPIRVALGKGDPNRTDFDYVFSGSTAVPGPRGLPLLKPPYGRVTAIDLNRGVIAWVAANGSGPRNHEALRDLNLDPLGWPGIQGLLLTRDLLFMCGKGSMKKQTDNHKRPMLYARDKKTGKLLHELALPAGTIGSPMTYLLEGRQYIVVAVGLHGEPESLIAYALRGE